MSKFKIGDKVKVIKKIDEHSIGEESIIIGFGNSYDYHLSTGGYINKENIKLVKSKNKHIKSLEKRVEEQQNEINELKVLVHQLRDNTTIVVKEDIKSNNELRAEIIEKAKVFVEKHKKYGPESNWRVLKVYTHVHCYAEFIINKEKRVVLALIKGLYSDLTILKGIAKCMPGDVFNEHIGKAIALGRALNIDVSEFENAIQPDSIVLGMLVKDKNPNLMDASGTVCKLKKGTFGSPGYENEKGKWNSFEYSEIIDDTNTIYNEVR